jgi:hypothetical protein
VKASFFGINQAIRQGLKAAVFPGLRYYRVWLRASGEISGMESERGKKEKTG